MILKNRVTIASPLAFSINRQLNLNGLTFIQTSRAYPESYDVFDHGNKIGSVYLKWGCLSFTTNGGRRTYEAFFESEYVGEFDNDELRNIMLRDLTNELLVQINRSNHIAYQLVECLKNYSKYGTTFANKGEEWSILGCISNDVYIIKGADGAIQMIEPNKFNEHFGNIIKINESSIAVCA